ncbi:Piwi domain-containing protein [Thamnocephalis sphaerospora]|uniref:Piwi domain-containing protein n=1 Tax=Thamnocephalis sphaerospora TaxID=78915 RepID=A0A4P9XI73_9FUNG|nr:Piwi domain-containing protein [Thamnocephalis sphaerospora]|eukprot:RKP05373.1 Piwi domain-containing protein [Thamnocephalis sphaerospora]
MAPYAPVSFVKRPGAGRGGRQVRINTNYYAFKTMPQGNIIQYDVTITPDVPPIINRQVMATFEEHNSARMQGKKLIYDGRKIAYAAQKMPFGDSVQADIMLPERDGRPPSKKSPRVFKLVIRKTTEINMHEIKEFLEGRCKTSPTISSGIMALDILLRHNPSRQFVTVGRAFYIDERDSTRLPGGLVARHGLYQSVRPTPGRLMANVDVSATAFYDHGPMVELACRVLDCSNPRDIPRYMQGRMGHGRLDTFVKGIKFVVTHRGALRPSYKAGRLTKTDANSTTFPIGDTRQRQSVAEYFQQRYQMRLQFPNLPCIEVKKDMYFPLEVCEVPPNQRYGRKLTPEQTDGMIRFTTHKPHERLNKIRQGIHLLRQNQDPHLRQFGVNIDTNNTVNVNARVLNTPRLQYNPRSQASIVTPANGAWNMLDKRLHTGASLKSWAVVVLADRLRAPEVERFVSELVNVCNQRGMNISAKNPPIEFGNRQGTLEDKLKIAFMSAKKRFREDTQLILCIVPGKSTQPYAEIKRVGETVIGIPTQCIIGKNVYRPNNQYLSNVCLKMNAKLGGVNVVLTPDQIPFIAQKPTIIIGADVSHPPPGDARRPSIATLVGSLDVNVSRFCSVVRFQDGRAESMNELRDMVVEALKAFYRNSGHKPARILFYRDGISEGEFDRIINTEVKAVKLACQQLEVNYHPTLTYIAVQKRHHTRFFPMGRCYACSES